MVEDTNPEKEGTRIHNVTLSRDLDTGATFVLVSAGMGGVKTGACLDYSEKIMSTYPNEKVFWRESLKSPVQFTKIQNFGYKIFIEKDYDLVFRDIKKNKVFTPEVFYFKTFRELVKLSNAQDILGISETKTKTPGFPDLGRPSKRLRDFDFEDTSIGYLFREFHIPDLPGGFNL